MNCSFAAGGQQPKFLCLGTSPNLNGVSILRIIYHNMEWVRYGWNPTPRSAKYTRGMIPNQNMKNKVFDFVGDIFHFWSTFSILWKFRGSNLKVNAKIFKWSKKCSKKYYFQRKAKDPTVTYLLWENQSTRGTICISHLRSNRKSWRPRA